MRPYNSKSWMNPATVLLALVVLFNITLHQGASSQNAAFASTQSGEVYAWGENIDGQLGDGSNQRSNVPVAANGLSGIISVATGYDGHSLALKADGTVWAWGANGSGQLGNGTNDSSSIPVRVTGLSNVIAIDTGGSDSGGVSMALKSDGTVWVWGENREGQLCNASGSDSNVPIKVEGLSGVVAIAAGDDYCMALKSDGTVWGWAENHTHGKLGNGTSKDPPRGTIVQAIGLSNAVDIDASIEHSLALTSDNRVWAWGGNFSGQLGSTDSEFFDDRYIPAMIIGLTGIVAIAAGDLHNLALKDDGTVYAWGANSKGQLGNGTFSTFYSFVMPVKGLEDVVAIAAGASHSMALKADGTVWAWGANGSGQLGDGTFEDRSLPVQVNGIAGCFAIAAGGRQSLAVAATPTTTALATTTEHATTTYSETVPTAIAIETMASETTAAPPGQTMFSLVVNVYGQGQASGGGAYEPGSIVEVNAVPAAGWRFERWTGDTSMISDAGAPNITMNIENNCSLTAVFSSNETGGFPAFFIVMESAVLSAVLLATLLVYRRLQKSG